ncbi:Uncharacterised protein [Serratia fonticola]|uniref:Uncharacterized protein n=1 Tax=Serratia fonticola TaxID=47917 RepID=A0A4U9TK79_SERFO|nr:Uncharacterised protein [Serratia fonticola]
MRGLLKQIVMQRLYHALRIIARYQEAQVIAAGSVADHADIERIQYAEYLFTDAAGL